MCKLLELYGFSYDNFSIATAVILNMWLWLQKSICAILNSRASFNNISYNCLEIQTNTSTKVDI